ncbi:class I SAM-dependent methyltransferase [Pelagibacteraceae bacterium]|jgi:ubiquinone/menaquinone biosynthesis C-methylase UbiE|nr:class I SAM-dependent methyltransferase [Pelagibacteraceae bacterium]|tara:strand:+ start:2496 stop:3206 length:711 start_codon:yes stop_codon:yes gene_type:complete
MKHLRNWDNKTWLSSNKYISTFHKFLKSKINIKKNTHILDIGCGRANIISFLNKKYKFHKRPVGIDIVKNKNLKKNIVFKKTDAIKYLNKTKKVFDLIIIKQTIHFFSKKEIKILLRMAKNHLKKGGKIIIFSLKTKNNKIPSFKIMKLKLKLSLKKDIILIKEIKKNLKKPKYAFFKYKVNISKAKYIQMIKSRYISCLLDISNHELKKGIEEIKSNYKNNINFTDTLNCIIYKK